MQYEKIDDPLQNEFGTLSQKPGLSTKQKKNQWYQELFFWPKVNVSYSCVSYEKKRVVSAVIVKRCVQKTSIEHLTGRNNGHNFVWFMA